MPSIRRTIILGVAALIAISSLVYFASIQSTGAWLLETARDPISDVVTESAVLIAEQDNGRLGLSCTRKEPVRLVIQLDTRTGGYRDEENYVDRMVRFRFDDGVVKDVIGTLGDHFIGFEANSRGTPRDAPIIAEMQNAKTFAIEVETVEASRAQAVFNVAGADKVISRLRKKCA